MIWCLPGFLGRVSDWGMLAGVGDVRGVELFDRARNDGLTQFGASFAAGVRAQDPAPILVGYSLGGRLALQAMIADPTLWRAAVMVSAHTGLDDAAERAKRIEDDERWAKRFESDSWDDVLAAWDARPVFGGSKEVRDRPETAYDRAALAHALRAWSLGRQEPLAQRLGDVSCPVLWVAGERDARFVAEGERAVAGLPNGRLAVAPGAGHRVPWEASEWFAGVVGGWLRSE